MESLKEVLMQRDNMTADEADELINDCKERVFGGEDPEEVLYELGIEPDYIFDILDI
jgi:hypothetical protein